MREPIVVVGSGLAGYTLAREFRKLDKETALTLITRDDGAFYSKPMLSNAFTTGKSPDQLAVFPAQEMAAQLQADLYTHTTLTALHPQRHAIEVQDARGRPREIIYSRLVLAVGADPVRVTVAGDGGDSLISINDLDDYRRFRIALNDAQQIAILGAGLVGCEFANDLCTAHKVVHVIDPGHGPLARFLPAAGQMLLRDALAKAGVNWHLGSMLAAVHHHGKKLKLVLKKADDSGEQRELEVDLVLSAVGLRPRLHVAEAAGLQVNRGIVTDRLLGTSAADVYALGDCAEVAGHSLYFVQPIMNAARALAKTLAGTSTPVVYPAMPVTVKTPAYPVSVLPPPPNWPGEWQVETQGDGVRATFTDPNGWMRGFALTGAATAEKNALVKKIPGLIE
ncbi:MAG: FAD-dependent oxidoreductase [Gammaproteobacteria bacterium]|nr:FAD-dependent oxidoreductase [Gammaproteobacteria bacterium]